MPQELLAIYDEIDKLAQEINLETPWTHAQAAEWDTLTLEKWLLKQKYSPKIAKAAVRIIHDSLLSSIPDKTSFLGTLIYIKSNKNLSFLLGTKNGAQEKRIVGGDFYLSTKNGASNW